jgi:hypothetical protein
LSVTVPAPNVTLVMLGVVLMLGDAGLTNTGSSAVPLVTELLFASPLYVATQ